MTAAQLFAQALERHQRGAVAEAGELYHASLRLEPDNAAAWCNLGVAAQALGRTDMAGRAYRMALTLDVSLKAALNNLGVMARQRGEAQAALATHRRVALLFADDAVARARLGGTLAQTGAAQAARRAYQAALALSPADPAVWSDLGNLIVAVSSPAAGLPALRRAVAARPEWWPTSHNLAIAAEAAGRPAEAEAAYLAVARRNPLSADAWAALADRRRPDDPAGAERFARQALRADPARADALATLSDALGRQGALPASTVAADRGARVDPANIRALNNLGAAHLAVDRFDEAVEPLRRACALEERAETLTNLGAALKGVGRLDQALATLVRAACLNPALPQTYNNLGNALRDLGRVDEAATCYRWSTLVKPDYAVGYRNLLPTLLYSSQCSPARRFEEQRRFAQRFAAPLRPLHRPHANAPDPERRLRIGYLSSDFRGHVVARNIMPLFEHRDRARFEVFCYAEVAAPDPATDRFRALSDGWRSTIGLDDRAAAAMIRDDRIDILVCLAGHFDKNRPLVAAYRPAPVQVSFHDPVSSGLDEFDYLIADPTLVPRGGSEPFSERVVRLPSYYLASPIPGSPDPTPPPCLTAGRITFGCFNAPSKIGEPVLALWARVLAATPGSRLTLKYRNHYDAPGLRRRFADAFAARGVDPARLTFLGAVEASAGHLENYAGVDIALDPFPFCGSTTTYEALWMGVPVATLPGQTMVSRWSASMLKPLRLSQLIAADADDYVAICRRLADDPAGLATLRAELRGRILASPLCDGRRRARQLERLYRAMWRRWRHAAPPND